ncbi:Uncharacterised protein [Burkholderia pseudomallei]|nr:Uncharacterised protein [Burkholderia pseudomallei]
MREIQADVREHGRLQPACAISEPVADARDGGERDPLPAARGVRGAEQQRGRDERDRARGRHAVREQSAQPALQIAAEQRFLGEADEQQIVREPQPCGFGPLRRPADEADAEREHEAHRGRRGRRDDARAPCARAIVDRPQPRQHPQQPEADERLVEIQIHRERRGVGREAHGADHARVVEAGQPAEHQRERECDEHRVPGDANGRMAPRRDRVRGGGEKRDRRERDGRDQAARERARVAERAEADACRAQLRKPDGRERGDEEGGPRSREPEGVAGHE